MAIPGVRMDDVPPPLPPPRYNHDLDQGLDIAWSWQNEDLPGDSSRLAPIKPGSSLLGHQSMSQHAGDENEDIDMDLDADEDALSSIPSTRRSSQSQYATGSNMATLAFRSPSSSGIYHRLPGENPLAQQNHYQSIYAYDKHLLQKIGKSSSSTDNDRLSPNNHRSLAQKLSLQTRSPNLHRPTQDPVAALDSATKWASSPPTSAISSTTRPSWQDFSMDLRSPRSESSQLPKHPEADFLLSPDTRSPPSRTHHASFHGLEHNRNRSERGSHDSGMNSLDAESVADDASLSSAQCFDKPRPAKHYGAKKRALSPSHERVAERRMEPPQSQPSSAGGAQSTALRRPYKAGSLSSTASSTQLSSHASSYLLSNASSVTSLSSIDTAITSAMPQHSIFESPSQSLSLQPVAIQPLRQASDLANAAPTCLPSSMQELRPAPSRIGNHYICGCCPKKPRKFDTEELLRAHENEKQYSCAYCNNRFKNKNEAERHQNSLHLRKQSWSCATIATYQAAFHPSSAQGPRSSNYDTCGFCGEDFPNNPANWEYRIEHLTNVHKFGECNATKKFYRADHFRQHLKHSHAGKSGKWTNILENNCQREEAPSEAASHSPTASEHSQSGSLSRLQSLANPADTSMAGVVTIDEAHEES